MEGMADVLKKNGPSKEEKAKIKVKIYARKKKRELGRWLGLEKEQEKEE